MNVHTPSFGDEVFEITDVGAGNISSSGTSSNYMYQQQTTPQQQLQTKRMINLHNTSDEYHTANDDSFTSNSMSFSGSPGVGMPAIQQQLQQKQGLDGTANTGTATPLTTLAARKQMSPADPNEPAKPLSAYALFFRDTVSAIKQQNPTCSFQELSKIVASMWESLDPVHKAVYNKKNEVARNDYIKQMRIYRQQHPQSQASTAADAVGGGGVQTSAATTPQQILQSKPVVFNINSNQQNQPQQPAALPQQQLGQNAEQQVPSNNTSAAATPASTTAASTSAPPDDQVHLLNEASSVQKCTRENCNKRAIINPDWEDEYCSNECVVVHCRNVFNAWVQSNLEAKQQQQPEIQQQPTQATT